MASSFSDIINPLEHLLGYQIRRVSSTLMGLLAAELARLDLSPSEASVLVLIAANPNIRQSGIGRILGIHRANMTPIAASLEQRCLIARERVDGRSYGLVLTGDGANLAAAALQAMNDHDAIIEALANRDRAPLATFLKQFRQALGATVPGDDE